MKNLKTFVFLMCVTAVLVILEGCASEEFMSRKGTMMDRPVSGISFNSIDQQKLNRLASTLANEYQDLVIINDAEIVNLTDNQGDFSAISFKYRAGARFVSMIVPVEEVSDVENLDEKVSVQSCIMKFYGSEDCTYGMIERCKALSVSGTGNSASVMFLDKK